MKRQQQSLYVRLAGRMFSLGARASLPAEARHPHPLTVCCTAPLDDSHPDNARFERLLSLIGNAGNRPDENRWTDEIRNIAMGQIAATMAVFVRCRPRRAGCPHSQGRPLGGPGRIAIVGVSDPGLYPYLPYHGKNKKEPDLGSGSQSRLLYYFTIFPSSFFRPHLPG
jgi:hypothetical protein